MPLINYRINHAVDSAVIDWAIAEPNFSTMEQSESHVQFTFDHADEAAQSAFKNLLAKQIGLSGENVNVFDSSIRTNVIITPPELTASVNDYNPTGASTATVFRLSADSDWNITGLQSGTAGRIIIIEFVGSTNAVILKNESTSSESFNRFQTGVGDIILDGAYNGSAIFIYDGILSRWRLIGSNTIADNQIIGRHIADFEVIGSKLGANTDWDLGTAPGVKLGTATTQKLGFFNKAPVVQPAANADTSLATTLQLETEVNELKALLRSLGLMAT